MILLGRCTEKPKQDRMEAMCVNGMDSGQKPDFKLSLIVGFTRTTVPVGCDQC